MSDVSITAANCVGTGTFTKQIIQFGETITAGQVLYQKAADSRFWKAQADGTSEESGYGVTMAIALGGGAAGQYGVGLTSGTVTIGGTVVATTEYVVSATAGGIAPKVDLVSTNKYTSIGYATTSAIISVAFNATGVAVP